MPEIRRNIPAQPRRIAAPLALAFCLAALPIFVSGCDPIIDVFGSVFPASLGCLVGGVSLAALLKWVFARTRIEPHLGPLILIYPALAFVLSCVIWLLA